MRWMKGFEPAAKTIRMSIEAEMREKD